MSKLLILIAVLTSVLVIITSNEVDSFVESDEYRESTKGFKIKWSDKSEQQATDKWSEKSSEESFEDYAEKYEDNNTEKWKGDEYKHRCAENERYERCPIKIRDPQTCDQIDDTCKNCDKEHYEEGDCVPACICIQGYIRNENRICKSADQICHGKNTEKKNNNSTHNECNRTDEDNYKCGCKDLDIEGDDNKGKCRESTNSTKCHSSSSKCFKEAYQLIIPANLAFSGALLGELVRKNPGENVMGTGPSILYLLAQLAHWTDEESYKQIMELLNFNNYELIKCYYNTIIPKLLSVNRDQYKFIYKIYSDSVCPLTYEFRKQTKDVFAFEPKNLDFTNSKSAKIINSEIEDATKGHIADYIKPNFLCKLSGLVLVSANYFKAQWLKQFDPLKTKERDFYVSAFKTIQVRTMHQTNTFLYTESSGLGAKILKMKYVGEYFSLAIILPTIREGFKDVLEKVRKPDILIPALDSLRLEAVKVYMPTFNMTVANRMKFAVEKANINKIFHNETAGLQDITPCNGTYVSEILQKATLQVDELGVGHAKTTDFDTEDWSPQEDNRKTIEFRANRPFIFFLFYEKIEVYFGVVNH